MRLQIALEYMIIFAFVLVVFLFLFSLIASQRAQTLGNQLFGQEQLAAQNIASQLSLAMQAGNGYTASIPISSQVGALSYQLLIGKNGAVLINSSVGTQSIQAIAYSGVQQVASNPSYLQANSFYYSLPVANGTLYIQNSFGTVCVDYLCPNTSSIPSNISLSSETAHAALFNGQTSAVQALNTIALAGPNVTNQVTVSAWINLPAFPGNEIVCDNGTGRFQLAAYYQGTGYYAGASPFGPWITDKSKKMYTNTWYMLSATSIYNPSAHTATSVLYINGQIVNSSTLGNAGPIWPRHVSIGTLRPGYGYWTQGEIANVQIYETALSSNQISALYNEGISGAPVNQQNLTGWWPLNGNANDYSGNGNNGVVTGPLLFPSVSELFAKVTNQAGAAVANTLVGFTTTLGSFIGNNAVANNYTNSNGIAIAFLNQQGNNGQALVKATAYNGNSSLAANLTGWYPLNFGQGNTTQDLSGNNNAYTGGDNRLFYGYWNVPNYVASFWGPSQPQIALNPFGTTQCSFTSSAWVKERNTPPAQGRVFVFIEYNAGGTQVWDQVNINDTGLQLALFNNSRGESSVKIPLTSSPKNKWTFIVTGSNSTNSFAYVDGVQVYSGNSVGCIKTNVGQGLGGPGTSTSWYNGSMANVQFYNAALTPSQIWTLYQNGTGAAPILPGNIIGWWPLNGNANDYSGMGNNGTIYGNLTFTKSATATNLNGNTTSLLAGSFNGVSSDINIGNPPTLAVNTITVIGWIYQKGNTATCQDAMAQYGGGSNGWIIRTVEGPGCGGTYNYDTYVNVGGSWYDCNNGPIPRNTWVQVGLTYDGSTLKGYTNGQQTCSYEIAGTLAINGATTIGSYGGPGEYFNGSISNVQIYHTALTDGQVQRLYQEGVAGIPLSTAGLVGWWPLNGNANDYSGMGNNGTATNVVYASQRVAPPLSQSTFGGAGVTFGHPLLIGEQANKLGQKLTISAWYYVSSIAGEEDVVRNCCSVLTSPANNCAYSFSITNEPSTPSYAGLHWETGYIAGTDGWASVNNAVPLDQWVYVVITYNRTNGNSIAYVNGKMAGTATSTVGGTVPTSLGYTIGRNCGPSILGSVADVQLYNTTLTASQVQQLYNAQTPPSAEITIPLSWLP